MSRRGYLFFFSFFFFFFLLFLLLVLLLRSHLLFFFFFRFIIIVVLVVPFVVILLFLHTSRVRVGWALSSIVTGRSLLAKGVLLLSNHSHGLQLNPHKPRRNFFKSGRPLSHAYSAPFVYPTKSPPYCILNEASRRYGRRLPVDPRDSLLFSFFILYLSRKWRGTIDF